MNAYKEKFETFSKEVEKHLYVIEKDLDCIKQLYPFDEGKIKNLLSDEEYLKTFDQIVYRFLKLQDTLGKLMRYFLLKEGELAEHLTMIDIINTLSKYGIDIDEEDWFEMRNLRNSLAHEYPDMYFQVAEAINSLYEFIPKIKAIFQQIKERS